MTLNRLSSSPVMISNFSVITEWTRSAWGGHHYLQQVDHKVLCFGFVAETVSTAHQCFGCC